MCRPTPLELPFAHPVVRDLAFLLASPAPWLTGADLPAGRLLGPTGEALLARLDAAPSALESWLARHPSRRLGHYAEFLLAFWFSHAPHCRLVAHGLPVRAPGGRTLGEYDFLLELDGEPVHIETCSKFYLQSRSSLHGLIGPDPRDTWCAKAERLQRQLLLSTTPQGARVLPVGFAGCRALAVVRGWMFYPPSSIPPPSPAPLNPQRLCGWLVREDAVWPSASETRWLHLPHRAWLAPARCVREPGSMPALRAALTGMTSPQLVAEMRCNGEAWFEVARGCVLPFGWPEKSYGKVYQENNT